MFVGSSQPMLMDKTTPGDPILRLNPWGKICRCSDLQEGKDMAISRSSGSHKTPGTYKKDCMQHDGRDR